MKRYEYRCLSAEQQGFMHLSRIVNDMLDARQREATGSGGFVRTFAEFSDFVKHYSPEAGNESTDSNPFPGILPSGSYLRASQPLASPDDVLLWSTRRYDRVAVPVQFRLCADGRILTSEKGRP